MTNLHDRGVISRYRQYLPVADATPVVSLNEGSTPLIYSPKLSALVGCGAEVYVKYEGLNPTGSFKDRGMTMEGGHFCSDVGPRCLDRRPLVEFLKKIARPPFGFAGFARI